MTRSDFRTENERVVINTGPLIALARAGALDVVGALPFTFVCVPLPCVESSIEVLPWVSTRFMRPG